MNLLENSMRGRIRKLVKGLYVIIDPEFTAERDPLVVAQGALEGGVNLIQLRDKMSSKGKSLPLARKLSSLCQKHQALFIVNDHADLAILSEADGLHLGQQDLPVAEARKVLSPNQITGSSNALLEEALLSQSQQADYIAVGSIFPTKTKENTRPAGLETLKRIKKAVSHPVVAIGGINKETAGEVIRAGADAICVSSAVGLAENPKAAVEELIEEIRKAGNKR